MRPQPPSCCKRGPLQKRGTVTLRTVFLTGSIVLAALALLLIAGLVLGSNGIALYLLGAPEGRVFFTPPSRMEAFPLCGVRVYAFPDASFAPIRKRILGLERDLYSALKRMEEQEIASHRKRIDALEKSKAQCVQKLSDLRSDTDYVHLPGRKKLATGTILRYQSEIVNLHATIRDEEQNIEKLAAVVAEVATEKKRFEISSPTDVYQSKLLGIPVNVPPVRRDRYTREVEQVLKRHTERHVRLKQLLLALTNELLKKQGQLDKARANHNTLSKYEDTLKSREKELEEESRQLFREIDNDRTALESYRARHTKRLDGVRAELGEMVKILLAQEPNAWWTSTDSEGRFDLPEFSPPYDLVTCHGWRDPRESTYYLLIYHRLVEESARKVPLGNDALVHWAELETPLLDAYMASATTTMPSDAE